MATIKQTQNQKIAGHLADGNKLTALQALKLFGCFRLAARVNDLRKQGMVICSELITIKGKTFAQYYLMK